MGHAENIEYIEQLEEENEELKDQMDSIVNDICNIINRIGRSASERECENCIETAKQLFELIQEYGDDNAQVDVLGRFSYLTGVSLNE